VGPLTRSSADTGIMLQAIAGQDDNDPTSLPDAVPDISAQISDGVEGIRIGLDEGHVADGVDPQLAQAVLDGVNALEGLGDQIVNVKMPDVDKYLPGWPVLCTAEALAAHRESYPSRRDDYGPWFGGWLDMGSKLTGADYAEANVLRNECNGLVRLVLRT